MYLSRPARDLPRPGAVLWSDFSSKDGDCPPTLAKMEEFIENRIQATETLSNTRQRSTTPASRRPNYSSSNHHKSRAFHLKESKSETCPACEGQHAVYQCATFKEWNTDRRHGLVRRKHLCFNCLSHHHLIEACSSIRTCRECKQKHHTLLHRNNRSVEQEEKQPVFSGVITPATPPEVPVSAPVTAPPVSGHDKTTISQVHLHHGEPKHNLFPAYIPVTALVTVSSDSTLQRARILLDNGSGITLVTSRLASSLKARKIKSSRKIIGLHGSSMLHSNHAVQLQLNSTSDAE